jgi:hypothetical protein
LKVLQRNHDIHYNEQNNYRKPDIRNMEVISAAQNNADRAGQKSR